MSAEAPQSLAQRLVAWQRIHGRHHLPWQRAPLQAYRVWLSEVMLQQTQVQTVKAYFERFVALWPDVHALAQADLDAVLAQWSGLGYYSRARNLHACAQTVVQMHGGQFPRAARELARLPGIGPSTAAAIAALCWGERVAILDGNVQRVLARHQGLDADLRSTPGRRAMQDLAQTHLPTCSADMPAYTQGLMDLGATCCTPRQPDCPRCPLRADCVAHACASPERWPLKRARTHVRDWPLWLVCLGRSDGAVWLEKRPLRGIWAGLWCLPVFETAQAAQAAFAGLLPAEAQPPVRHDLTHRRLSLHVLQGVVAARGDQPAKLWPGASAQTQSAGHSAGPVEAQPQAGPFDVLPQTQAAGRPGQWWGLEQALTCGLPAPIRRMLQALR